MYVYLPGSYDWVSLTLPGYISIIVIEVYGHREREKQPTEGKVTYHFKQVDQL